MFHDFLTELEMITLKQMTLAEIEVKYVLCNNASTQIRQVLKDSFDILFSVVGY